MDPIDINSNSFRFFQRAVRKAEEKTRKNFEQLDKIFKAQKPFLDRLFQFIDYFVNLVPEANKFAFNQIISNGWYIDPHQPIELIFECATYYSTNNNLLADEKLSKYYNSRVKSIEKKLCSTYPNRIHIFRSAFKAHRNKEYNLSVPLLLMQADGICAELTKLQLYRKRNGKLEILDYLKKTPDYSHLKDFILPLIDSPSISMSKNERKNNSLNRHAVLHGESTDYGTFQNSCKSISFLVYIDWILNRNI